MSQLPKPSPSHDSERDNYRRTSLEFKKKLLKFADARHIHEQRSMLDTGRGNPNWTAIPAREAFFALGMFAMSECKLDRDNPSGLSGVPQKQGIAKRFYKFLQESKGRPGIELLTELYKNGVRYFSPDVEELIFEFTEGVTGSQYPQPVRMLHYCEKVMSAFLLRELSTGKDKVGEDIDLFATEGGTAAICYIFDSLMGNCLLKPGDKVVIGVPAPTTYVEVTNLEKYGLDVIYMYSTGRDENGIQNQQYPPSELDKLADKSVKAFFVLNPGNPTSVMIDRKTRKYMVDTIKEHNPDLMVITDSLYGTFVNGFSSLMSDLPRNTISVYSLSKYFGCTGWRLGVIGLQKDNIYDRMLAELPAADKQRLDALYNRQTGDAWTMKFIDRLAADSRNVSLYSTAGLSTPQQVQMALFAGFAIIDRMKKRMAYKRDCNDLVRKRYKLFWEGMGMPAYPNHNKTYYYCMFDIEEWANKTHGPEFFAWLRRNFTPADIVSHVAEECSVIMVNAAGFCGSAWSVCVSMANLDSHEYKRLGQIFSATLREYERAWPQAE